MIETFSFSKFPNALHYEYMIETDGTILEIGISPDRLDIEADYQLWKASLELEERAMRSVQGSVLTKEIAVANQLRDDYYQGMQHTVLGAQYHYDTAARSSAERIERVIKQYGNPVRMGYKAATGILRSLTSDFEGKLATDMEKVGASHWIAPLKQANLAVETLIGSRSDEELSQSSINMKDARTATDALYKKLIARINALALVKGGEAYEILAQRQNARIAYFKNTIALSGPRAKKSEPEE